MRNKWMTGAMLATLVMVTSAAAQDCGCSGNSGCSGATTATGRCPHAWTYEDASALWDGYCQEQPYGHNGCGLFGCRGRGGLGCGTTCGSRWPTSDCGCESGSNNCGINFCGLGRRVGGGCGCEGGVLSGFSNAGCGTDGNFGWASCGCDGGCGAGGFRHGFSLGGGLRAWRPGGRSCDGGCDGGAATGSSCGCN
jgi:hypothetical protein